MYAGRIVEHGHASTTCSSSPLHPYTQGLIGSRAEPQPRAASRCAQIPGMTPSLLDLPPGCAFRDALPARRPAPARDAPPMRPRDAARERALLPPAVAALSARPHDRAHDRRPLLELRGVSKRFVQAARPRGDASRNLLGANVREEVVHAVDDVDLAVAPGEVVGLVGESGCGKSTLGRIVAGMLTPTRGERCWRGAPLRRPRADERARAAARRCR